MAIDLPPSKGKDVEVIKEEKLPNLGEPFQIVLEKSHLWVAFVSVIIASAITATVIFGQVATRISVNAACGSNQVKMSEFSGVGMSVTCIPLDTYLNMKKPQKRKRGAV